MCQYVKPDMLCLVTMHIKILVKGGLFPAECKSLPTINNNINHLTSLRLGSLRNALSVGTEGNGGNEGGAV